MSSVQIEKKLRDLDTDVWLCVTCQGSVVEYDGTNSALRCLVKPSQLMKFLIALYDCKHR